LIFFISIEQTNQSCYLKIKIEKKKNYFKSPPPQGFPRHGGAGRFPEISGALIRRGGGGGGVHHSSKYTE
jgi:hypothetical protein